MNSVLILAALVVPQTADEIRSRAKELQPKLTEFRPLKLKDDIKIGVYTKAQLRDFITKEFDSDLTPEEIAAYQKAYAAFGLIPKDLDLKKAYIDLLAGGIAGFYHPHSKELKLILPDPANMSDSEKQRMKDEEEMGKQLGVKMSDLTLIHEMTHGAQDQNFDLETVGTAEEDNDDIVAALKCCSEGDAMLTEWKYGVGDKYNQIKVLVIAAYSGSGEDLPDEAGKVPRYLRETLTFSYGPGFAFVDEVFNACGGDYGKYFERIYQDPPSSTEQIIHPKKYLKERDNPVWIELPDLSPTLGAGWKKTFTNVWGELVIKIMLIETKACSTGQARRAAAGWGGDKAEAYEGPGGKIVTVWFTTWDSDSDAEEFADAYGKANPANGAHRIHAKDRDVLVVDGLDDDADVQARLWKEARKSQIVRPMRLPFYWVCPDHASEKKYRKDRCSICQKEMTPIEQKVAPVAGQF